MIELELTTLPDKPLEKALEGEINPRLIKGIEVASDRITSNIKASFDSKGERGLGKWKPTTPIAREARVNPAARDASANTLEDTGQYRNSFTILSRIRTNTKIANEIGSPLEAKAIKFEQGEWVVFGTIRKWVEKRKTHYISNNDKSAIEKSVKGAFNG